MSDTIAAIVTPAGEGGVGLLRISGPEALALARGLFHPAEAVVSFAPSPWRVYFGEIRDPAGGTLVDEVLLTFYKAPKSFTAEDVVEIAAHGGMYITSRILDLIVGAGARLAEPGEFTRRAFQNGRIDLSQAEAVAGVIAAQSERALMASLDQLKGRLSARLNDQYERLIAVIAQLEASIDFPEEGLKFQKSEALKNDIDGVAGEMDALIESYRQGKIISEGARVAIVGKPNAGKSSLLNALLAEDRAIVTPHPGTTRDLIEERVRIRDIHIRIIDSAGLRKHPEVIEEEGIERTRAALAGADLALMLFDASQPLDENDELLLAEAAGKKKLVVLNKCDLPERLDTAALLGRLAGEEPVRISAREQTNLGALVDAIHDRVLGGEAREPLLLTRARHREQLVDARQALSRAGDSLGQGLSEEFIALDVDAAAQCLGRILGKVYSEDLLDEIFNEFCIGK
ncbi:MAG: tRNA uridine-5-carboxymethylaminomethyl(34) synthesis GTPase MnmE [Nitrospinaceae bacterium]|nr:MAG: tRNA uridine-5-carboxymethylaminomethyl(34) synthesis GTPase MnmE [Nitrospinaceae bacterium]